MATSSCQTTGPHGGAPGPGLIKQSTDPNDPGINHLSNGEVWSWRAGDVPRYVGMMPVPTPGQGTTATPNMQVTQMAANDPYAGVTLIAAPGTDPYAGVTGRQIANPTGPADMGPQMAPPSALENFGRTLYGDVAAPGIAAQSAVGGLAGSAAHLAGAVASDTGLAAPGAGARWDAAAQRYLAPPAPESPAEGALRNAPAAIMDPRYNPITGAAQAAGNALDQHLPAGAEHVIGDYLVPGANLAPIFLGPEAAEQGGLTRPPLAKGAPGTENAIARAPNDVADAAELGRAQV